MRYHNIRVAHKLFIISIIFLIFESVFTACRSPIGMASETQGMTSMAELHTTVTLGIGRKIAIQKEDLVVRFISVLKDSHCPIGVRCIWEGDAEILIEVADGRGDTKSFTLHTSQRFKQEETINQYKFQLISLKPYPQRDVDIKPESYELTLLVDKK